MNQQTSESTDRVIPRDKGRFAHKEAEPLSKSTTGVRLPQSVHEIVSSMPNKAEWLRKIISEAAQKEISTEK